MSWFRRFDALRRLDVRDWPSMSDAWFRSCATELDVWCSRKAQRHVAKTIKGKALSKIEGKKRINISVLHDAALLTLFSFFPN